MIFIAKFILLNLFVTYFYFSLHLLSVLLVICCGVISSNINEPVIDAEHTTAINLLALNHRGVVIDPSIESIVNTRPQLNQSLRAINHAIITDDDDVRPILAINKPITKSISSGKLYNKNDLRKRKIKSTGIDTYADWKCPNISENSRYLECGCDLPQTLRCSGDIHGLEQIAYGLRNTKYPVSLLDCTLKNVTFLSDARIFDGVSLHGLVISSGEIKRVHRQTFLGMKIPLLELGLPNNALSIVPSQSLSTLIALQRLDLSNNRIKYLDASDFLVSKEVSSSCSLFVFVKAFFSKENQTIFEVKFRRKKIVRKILYFLLFFPLSDASKFNLFGFK